MNNHANNYLNFINLMELFSEILQLLQRIFISVILKSVNRNFLIRSLIIYGKIRKKLLTNSLKEMVDTKPFSVAQRGYYTVWCEKSNIY